MILLALAYGAITFQQSGACGVCLDISHRSAGAMTGLFNTASYLGSLVGSVAYGYIQTTLAITRRSFQWHVFCSSARSRDED